MIYNLNNMNKRNKILSVFIFINLAIVISFFINCFIYSDMVVYSGIVYDNSSDLSLRNVMVSGNNSTRTDENGKFTLKEYYNNPLEPTIKDKHKIKFEKKGYITEYETLEIGKDNNKIYLNPAPTWHIIFSDDFESGSINSNWYSNSAILNAVTTNPFDGTYCGKASNLSSNQDGFILNLDNLLTNEMTSDGYLECKIECYLNGSITDQVVHFYLDIGVGGQVWANYDVCNNWTFKTAKDKIDLSSLNVSNFYIIFRSYMGGIEDFYIDNVVISIKY